jgi:O-antigen/teichoic acid export membrane protein
VSKVLYTAIKKSIAGKLFTYVVQFIALAIYARVFTPEQFGVIASFQVFIVFFQIFADIGIGPAIINEEHFGKRQRDGIFTLTLLMGLLLSSVFYCLSGYIEGFYGRNGYDDLYVIVCISIIFYSLNIIPLTSLNKDAKFIDIAKVDTLCEVLTFFVVYFLYYLGFGIYALAIKNVSQSIFKFLFTWSISSKTTIGRAKFGKEIYHIKKIYRFATYQFLFNTINYFTRNLDNILVAKYFGSEILGIYEKSYQLMRYPLMLTTFSMTPAIQPVLTKYKNDIDKVVVEHNKLANRLLFISILISVFIYFNSREIVLLLFGEQWIEVIQLIKIFCIIIPVQAVMSTSGSFFQVINKPRLLFYTGLITALINIIAIILGVIDRELEILAKYLVVSFSINFFICYLILFKLGFQRNIANYLFSLIKTAIVATFPVLIYVLIKIYIVDCFYSNVIVSLIINVISSLVILFSLIKPMRYFLKNNI